MYVLKCFSTRTNNDDEDDNLEDDQSDQHDDSHQDHNNLDQGTNISYFVCWVKLCFSLNSKEKESLLEDGTRL